MNLLRPAESKRTRMRRRLLELAAEVAIAGALVIGIALYVIYGPKEPAVDWKWIAFAVNTIFVFGYALKFVRPLWTKPKLWAVVAGLVLLHAFIGWAVISRVERIPLVWYVPVDMGEIWAALNIIQWAFTDDELNQCAPPADAHK
jgi:hypothetical protein